MSRSLWFALLWVVGLAALTFAAAVVVQNQTRTWFERDLSLRATLAVNGARGDLLASWGSDLERMDSVLTNLAQDERILGACACSPSGQELARTDAFPPGLSCREIVGRIEREGPASAEIWTSTQSVAGGKVHVASLPIDDAEAKRGYVILAQDLSFVARRDRQARQFLLMAFGILALCVSVLTIVASRMSWRAWSGELRRFLHVGGHRKEFQPIMGDVRELVERLMGHEGRAWTPQRLKETMRLQLEGERVVLIANREPYVHVRAADGSIQVMHPASGLVTALEPVLRACSGTWVAHASGSGDRETSDRHGRLRVPPVPQGSRSKAAEIESYMLRRVWLTEKEERGYYYGFSNEGLWPLCHIAHTRPQFRSDDWVQYSAVNSKFVKCALEEVDSPDPIVLVQDYHFALAPALIRAALPRSNVIMFWHIPWPNAEMFGICPYRKELLEGMLGASILGFHTQLHCNNFLDAVDRFLEARIDRERNAVIHRGRETLVKPYPISIEWPMRQLAQMPAPKQARAEVYRELDLAPGVRLGVGIDRLDYTKGIEERLLAVERLFERRPDLIGRFTFVQLAAPSRTSIERYQQLNDLIVGLSMRIDRRFARKGWHPVILRREHHEPPVVFRYLRAADLCYVSSLHDGMNLVAKEFVAAREDERGVLLLSQFTGAARELTEALIVNPYNLDEAADALAAAIEMTPEDQSARMRAMRSYLAEFNVYGWAGKMLIDAARLRQRERLIDRITKRATLARASAT